MSAILPNSDRDKHNHIHHTSVRDKQHPNRPRIILGIESSCDDTACAVISAAPPQKAHPHTLPSILSSCQFSQNSQHAPYGGVVPEIAARAHMDILQSLISQAMQEAQIKYTDLDAIAVTAGPGLIGGVMTGLMHAKGLSLALGIPLLPINHLEGHALSPRLEAICPFPYLLLLISGGHTQLVHVSASPCDDSAPARYQRLGTTLDDAAGEAFDKTAKLMGLDFPGGPALEKLARQGKSARFNLPRPLLHGSHTAHNKAKDYMNFSFSGLKTAVIHHYQGAQQASANKTASQQDKADLAASLQTTIADILCDRTQNAMDAYTSHYAKDPKADIRRLVVAGGVAANTHIRTRLEDLCARHTFNFIAPSLKFCTDNAAMIALAGAEHLHKTQKKPEDLYKQGLLVSARARWPLDTQSAQEMPASGSGKKGPKS